jgi:hypothetical protein
MTTAASSPVSFKVVAATTEPGLLLLSQDKTDDLTLKKNEEEEEDKKDIVIQKLRSQLALMSEGMRLLAVQIRQADRHGTTSTVQKIKALTCSMEDEYTVATESYSGDGVDTVVSTTTVGEPSSTTMNHVSQLNPSDIRLGEIMQDLTRSQTADLMALQNAVHIVQQHAQLAAQEAVWAVQDSVQAQRVVQTWQKQMTRTEKRVRKLQAENTKLAARNSKLTAERRLLIQEVRKLWQNKSSSQHFYTTILEAMQLHQEHLKHKTLEVEGYSLSDDSLSKDSNSNSVVLLKTNDKQSIQTVESNEYEEDTTTTSTPTSFKMSTPPSSPVNLRPNHETVSATTPMTMGTISPITPGFPATPVNKAEHDTSLTLPDMKESRRNRNTSTTSNPPHEDLIMPRTIFSRTCNDTK